MSSLLEILLVNPQNDRKTDKQIIPASHRTSGIIWLTLSLV